MQMAPIPATLILLCAILFAYRSGGGMLELALVCLSAWLLFNTTQKNEQTPENQKPSNHEPLSTNPPKGSDAPNPVNVGEQESIFNKPIEPEPVAVAQTSSPSSAAPYYPMLSVENAAGHDAQPRVLMPNARRAVPVKTRNFEGHCLLMLRSRIMPTDPHHAAHFEGKKRMFEFQVQGRFTKPPRGTVYLGGEVPKPMGLSLIARGLAKVLLSLISSIIPGLNYHMGTKDGTVNPYIVFPLWTAVDRMMVTQPGEDPPELGGEIEETDQQRKIRRSAKTDVKNSPFSVGPTYTFNFHTGFVDLLDWKVVNLPAMTDIDLHSFWSTMPLTICLYDVADDPKVHLNGCKNILLAWRINHVDEEDYVAEQVHHDSTGTLAESAEPPKLSFVHSVRPSDADSEGDSSQQVKIPAWFEWAATDSHKRQPLYALYPTNGSVMRLCVLADFMPLWSVLHPGASPPSCDVVHRRDARTIDHQREMLERLVSMAARSGDPLALDAVANLISNSKGWSPRFLKGASAADVGVRPTSSALPVHEGAFVRAQWSSHWTQEWGRLYPSRLSLYRTHSRKPCLKIAISDVIEVSAVEESANPLPGLFLLQIATTGKVWLLGMASSSERAKWISEIQKQVLAVAGSGPDLKELSDARESFLTPSYQWWPLQCNVLNHRRMILQPPTGAAARSPVFLAEALLRGCLQWASIVAEGEDGRSFVVTEFLDATVELAGVIGLESLSDLARISFWTNVYHCLLVHSFITIGAPVSFRKWPAFFNNVCYEVGGCVVSLAEIEHCILRKQSANARGWLVKTQLPKWAQDDTRQMFALQRAEPKVNFLLNCGSVSYPHAIPVFGDETRVQRQVDAAVEASLDQLVTVSAAKNEISLPKVCDLYCKDFGSSNSECLQTIQAYMSPTKRQAVRQLLNSAKSPKIKISALSSQCRLGFSELTFRRATMDVMAQSMLDSSSDEAEDEEREFYSFIEDEEMAQQMRTARATLQPTSDRGMLSLRDGQVRYL